MPPSISTGMRPSTASTTSGRASIVAGRVVELAAAVVRDDDTGGAVLDRELGVLGPDQALDQYRQLGLASTISARSSQSSAGIDQPEDLGHGQVACPTRRLLTAGAVISAGTSKPVRKSRSRLPA